MEPFEEVLPTVFQCRLREPETGTFSYLIQRPQGNLLVDTPPVTDAVLAALTAMGGVAALFLTDASHTAKAYTIVEKFGCAVIAHEKEGDATGLPEVQTFFEDIQWTPEIRLLALPGRTNGSAGVYYEPQRALFTGDLVTYDGETFVLGLTPQDANRMEKRASILRLVQIPFQTILRAHGNEQAPAVIYNAYPQFAAFVEETKQRALMPEDGA